MAVSGKNKASSAGALEMAVPAISRKELVERLRAEFPEGSNAGGDYDIEALWRGGCRLRQRYNRRSLRPGGTLSGTTNLTINFLRKPPAGDLVAEARLLKLGSQLAVGEVAIRADGDDELVAHVTSTYSIPR